MDNDLLSRISRTLQAHIERCYDDPYISITTERLNELKALFPLDHPAPTPAWTLLGHPLKVDDTLPADPGYAVTGSYF